MQHGQLTCRSNVIFCSGSLSDVSTIKIEIYILVMPPRLMRHFLLLLTNFGSLELFQSERVLNRFYIGKYMILMINSLSAKIHGQVNLTHTHTLTHDLHPRTMTITQTLKLDLADIKRTTTLSIQHTFRSIFDHIQLQVFVTVAVGNLIHR